MSRLVTRCPYCDTSFRVTEEQLSVARGSVRCGACLSVFTATQYLVEDEPGLVDEANPAEDTDDATPWQAEAEIEDDLPDYHEPDPIWDDEPVIEGIVEDDEAEADDLTGEASDEPSEIEEIDAPDTTQLENISLIDDEFGPDAYRGEVNVDAVADEIVLEYQPEPHRHYLAWAGASLAMVALLTLQLAWFNKDRLAEQPE
ncbi:MAG TPA: MJ0042-type zinc finger domain-containing protein, partial [Pseudomonadales bacterium]|nr:MJ0042-type zinc finger domain-containing protein [Pseudomonadales bacterium]